MLAIAYDIHGNLPALEAVIGHAEQAGATRWLLGGDYASWSPWPEDTIELLRSLPETTWIRGNSERWVREPPVERPALVEVMKKVDAGLGADEGWLYSLQAQVVLDGVLYCHGCPQADDDSFAVEPEEADERRLAGIHDQTVVFGHSHVQFRRAGPNGTDLVNPGSVGMPIDGDVRAAYALRPDGGDFEFHRVEYDNERAAAAYEAVGPPLGELAARRIRRGSD